ncbi:hypothetical protein Ccur_05140 [Cryptobacterium curtum DSM 15641]|uniref:Shikimate 5-dehydrogenase n=1 Tax=Cryptobacterium curtum (strain ATCC 700683 / DSM 15641 / CCUG 43107 / 12-3) TaxID=469378 RepID=C7MMU5_CRYCD|nr:hypothetical protein [Cryptobacterium curtum]ACU94235.1 hypothetical protein Ccur_05140 [Cryptobacterium curtum DSM 15641]
MKHITVIGDGACAHLVAQALSFEADLRKVPWDIRLRAQGDAQALLADAETIGIVAPLSTHARAAYEVASIRAASCQATGACDVVLKRGQAAAGMSSWGKAFVSLLREQGFNLNGSQIAICSTEPAAGSFALAAATAGAKRIVVITPDKVQAARAARGWVSSWGTVLDTAFDLGPAPDDERSLHEAYRSTNFQFGSFATSTKALRSCDIVLCLPEEQPISSASEHTTDSAASARDIVAYGGISSSSSGQYSAESVVRSDVVGSDTDTNVVASVREDSDDNAYQASSSIPFNLFHADQVVLAPIADDPVGITRITQTGATVVDLRSCCDALAACVMVDALHIVRAPQVFSWHEMFTSMSSRTERAC